MSRAIHAFESVQPGYLNTGYNGSTQTVTGNRATIVQGVNWIYIWKPGTAQAGAFWTVDAGKWRFHLVKGDGWQVCQVDTPDLCTEVIICDPAKRQPVPSATAPASDDPLGNLRSMLPCAPQDPFRQYHSCPPDPAESSSPTG